MYNILLDSVWRKILGLIYTEKKILVICQYTKCFSLEKKFRILLQYPCKKVTPMLLLTSLRVNYPNLQKKIVTRCSEE